MDETIDFLNTPSVGIVLPIYNQKREYIFECLFTIEHQLYKNIKLIIVIDGANSDTIKYILEGVNILKTLPYEIVQRSENKGIAYSLNEGFSYLKDYSLLTWISSDNRHNPEFLYELVNAMMSENGNTVLVYSLFDLINEHGIKTSDRDLGYIPFMNRPKEHIIQNCFIGASFLFKRDAYEKSGGYNPKYEKVEDYEFWIRLINLGEIKFLNKSLMDYRLDGEYSYTTTTPKEELMFRGLEASYDHRILGNDIPKVTVLLTGHNHEKYIYRSIQSVLKQTYDNFHLILLDDASNDNTWHIMNQTFDSRIIPIRLSINRGKAATLNIGLDYALGEYILELDGDDWLEPNTLEIMVTEMDRQPSSVALCYANRKIWFDNNGELSEGPIYSGLTHTDKYDVLVKLQTHGPRLYRKSALIEVGKWPIESFPGKRNIIEDYHLMLILSEKYKFYWIDKVLYNQLRHARNLTLVNSDECRAQIKHIIENKLIQWGNRYKPIFHTNEYWVTKVELVSNGKD